jgi:tetratricopeptide (TPR) repeat protein
VDRSLAIKKRAQQFVQKGQIDAALAEFDRLFESGDKDPYDFIVVADLLAKRGSMQEAVRRYRQAIQEYSTAELYKNAIAVCKKILRISKEDLEIHRTLGELYAKEGLYGDAQIHYLEFAEGSIRRREYDTALGVIEAVLKLSPDNFELSEKYVEIAMRADEPTRGARELLRRAARLEELGRVNETVQLRERASTLDPEATLAPPASTPDPSLGAPEPGVLTLESPYAATAAAQAAARAAEAPRATEEVAASGVPPGLLDGLLPKAEPAAPSLDSLPMPPPSEPEVADAGRRAEDRASAAEETWKAAEIAFFRGDLTRARTLLEALRESAPNHEPALRRLVDITVEAQDRSAEARARFDLGELYLTQEEWALSRAEFMRVLELDSGNDRARMRIARLDTMNGDAPAQPIDLDSLPNTKPNASVTVRDEVPVNSDNLVDLEEIIDEFKAGVSNSISGEDHESHYDLGMAYMEMGLHDEAIREFQIASKGAALELKCLEMIALCHLEKNEPAAAARELSRALELPGHGPDETISIRYNLGMACERLGNLDKALQHFEEVYLLNVDFFKVGTKVRELKQRIAAARNA